VFELFEAGPKVCDQKGRHGTPAPVLSSSCDRRVAAARAVIVSRS
jgi:hypothetical protein